MIYVQGQRWTPSVCSRPPSCIASWQKQFHRWINNRDEWRWQCSDTWDQKARTASGHAVHPLDIYTLLLNHWQLKASNFSENTFIYNKYWCAGLHINNMLYNAVVKSSFLHPGTHPTCYLFTSQVSYWTEWNIVFSINIIDMHVYFIL